MRAQAAGGRRRSGQGTMPAGGLRRSGQGTVPAGGQAAAGGKRTVPERVRAMYELYSSGASLAEVGRAYGVTRERVRQLFAQAGLATRTTRETWEARKAAVVEAVREEVIRLYRRGARIGGIAKALGVPMARVRELVQGIPPVHRYHRPPRPAYSPEDVLSCLREGASEAPGALLTAQAYNRMARCRRMADGRPWPSAQTCAKRFGSWTAALQAAGLPANQPSPAAGMVRFDEASCVEALRIVAGELGRPPSVDEYAAYAAQLGGDAPSVATIRNRCGSWGRAMLLALGLDAPPEPDGSGPPAHSARPSAAARWPAAGRRASAAGRRASAPSRRPALSGQPPA